MYIDELKQTFCRYEMVCDNPKGNGVEIIEIPEFFHTKPDIETTHKHVHPFYEIIWFEKGNGKHTVDFKEYIVEDNTIFFIAPGQVHSFDSNLNCKGIVMKICSHLLTENIYDDTLLLKYNVFNTYDSNPYKHISEEEVKTIHNILSQIKEEVSKANVIGHKDYLQSLVTMFLIQIERSQIEEHNSLFSTNKASQRTFLSFRREIENNYRKLHIVKEYAELLNISSKSLTNYVSECSNYTPLEMINNRILLEAKRMLRYSDMMIKEIAYHLGFEDPSYFIKFFKRYEKCSPAEYRTPE